LNIPSMLAARVVNRRTALIFTTLLALMITGAFLGRTTLSRGRLNNNPSVGAANQAYVATASGLRRGASSSTMTVTVPPSVTVTNNNDSGSGSLRDAIANVDVGGTIDFDPMLIGQTITLTGGELLIDKNLTIQGPTGALTISGNNASRIFNVSAGVNFTFSNLTISGGQAGSGSGGGISNLGNLTILNSTLTGNSATSNGGAILTEGGVVRIINSTISGNNAGSGVGGGLFNGGTSQTTITNSTITNNNEGIRHLSSSPLLLNNTIVARNPECGSCDQVDVFVDTMEVPTATIDPASSNNLIGVNTGVIGISNGVNGNQIGSAGAPVNPLLGPLANNGGPTFTHALNNFSPAVDAGNNALAVDQNSAALTTDQRGVGFVRIVDGSDTNSTDTVDIGAFEVQVSVEDITDKATNEDTQLQFTFNVGGGGNITSVTATSANTTLVPNDVANIALSGSGSTRTLTINPAANQFGASTITVTVNGPNSQSMSDTFVLTVNTVADTPSVTNATTNEDTQTLSGLMISRNAADGAEVTHFKVSGITNGALFKNNGTTPINNGDFITFAEGNVGLKFTPATNLFSPGTTFSFQVQGATSNTGTGLSPGFATANITVNPIADTPSVTNATTTVNTQSTSGLVISRNAADGAEVTNFKITNITNGTLFKNDGTTQINNNQFITFAEGNAGLKFTPALNSNANGIFDVQASLNNNNSGLGGGTATATVTVNCGSTVVTNGNDSGAGSLRDVILQACPGSTITFQSGLSTITLTSGEFLLNKSLTFQGPGANLLTIQRSAAGGTPLFSIFVILDPSVTTNISGLTLSNADWNANGGAIRNSGTMTISGVTLSNNHTTVGGSAILNAGTGNLTLSNSTLSGNRSDILAAIYNQNGTMTISNSTLNGNANLGNAPGTAIFSEVNSVINLTNCTISQNTGQSVAVFQNSGGTGQVNLKNSIVSGNTGGDVSGVTNNGNNLIGGTSLLAPLGNYGGPTQTMALLPGSPAINAGTSTGAPATDQRGVSRLGAVDIGAFESRGFTISATSGTPQSAIITSTFASPLLATVGSSFGEPVAGGVITFTAPASGPSAVLNGGVTTLNVGINASGQASTSATANATAGGPYDVTATGNGIASSAAFSLTNTKAATSTTVSSTVNPSDLNQSVTFRANVSSVAQKTGTVQFKDNGSNLGAPVALDSLGVALLTTSSLTAGTHTITAEYSGDANFLPSTGTLAGGQVVKAQPSLSINDISITEGNAGTKVLTFTVTLSAASNLTVTTTFNTANGTATAGSDYVATNGTLTFNPGETTRTIPVTINGDVNFEPDETFTVNLSNPVNATISDNQGLGTIQNDDALGGFISFSQANTNVNESAGIVTLTVTRGFISFSQPANTEDVLEAANVDYATEDTGASTNCAALNTGLASQRCDYTSVFGTLKFAAGEVQKTIDIPIHLDAYNEGPEVFTVKLSNPTGGAVALPSTATVTINDSASPTPNAIDDTTNFVRQQYRDFLNREADPAGLAFWKNNIDKCNDPAQRPPGQTLAACIEIQRITTSAAFFLSIEFKQTGGLVREFYVAALDRPATNNMPNFVEFMRDTQGIQKGVVVGQGNWQQVLDANRTVFMNEFVVRAEFVALYPTTDTPTQYVDKLYLHAGVAPANPGERAAAIAEFGSAATAADPGARGRALLRVTQNAAFQTREANRTFVQIEYFGYLRRNPNDAPDNNFNGFNFWVNKLNQFNGDFLQAEMVKAFLSSLEYRRRFGP